MEAAQKNYDSVLLRAAGQSKTKEPSSLREEAFQVHEARKAYLKASMDFCVLAPQLRSALDSLLIRVSGDEWNQIKTQQQASSQNIFRHSKEMDRIGHWAKEIADSEKLLKRQLLVARKQIEDEAEASTRPSRELDDYAVSTVPYLGSGSRPGGGPASSVSATGPAFKQGWLFLRTITGKPARTQWVRRWFFVKNGIFGCLIQGARSGGVEESEKIGVLLCGLRPAFQEERRFCFEIKTKDTSILLQAETQKELMDWMSAFEKAKQKAIEEPIVPDRIVPAGNPSSEAAFAVSPAVAPELAAKGADGQFTTMTEDSHASHLNVEENSNILDGRHSVDVSQISKRGPDRDGDGSRDHAARILQKLDLHRKTTAGSQLNSASIGAAVNPAGGINGLLAASQAAIAIGGVRARGTSPGRQPNLWAPSLAPSTLVNLPVQTNLSKTAIKVGVDKGVDLGVVDSSGGVPSGLMANQWGSANYGYISRAERGEVERKPITSPPTPARRSSDPTDTNDIADPPTPQRQPSITPSPEAPRHRKTVSAEARNAVVPPTSTPDFPSFYPIQLRPHDTQFRMLFPNVSHTDRIVMVFRASWEPEKNSAIPGRVFVTPSELFFYGNHLGMVVVRGALFSDISEVSTERGVTGDWMYLHLKESAGKEETLQLRVFLDSPKLLQRRLNYLTSNFDSEEPDELESVLHTLVRLGQETDQEQGLSDSEEAQRPTRRASQRSPSGYPVGLRVDRGLPNGGDMTRDADADVAKFRLPPQPVNYKPIGMSAMVFEKVFDVSAKALLHIIYGDKSAVCSIMSSQRGAEAIKQRPWAKLDDEGHFIRQLEYTVKMRGRLGFHSYDIPVIDTQKIDVASDHLCYVVTETKVPWHLPGPQDFALVSKIVITHEAKSKCKLAIYTRVDWLHEPWLSKSMIQRSALDDMELDALNMADLVTEQVQRLGPSSPTRKIIEIYGYIGTKGEGAQGIATDFSPYGRPLRVAVRRRSLMGLVLETLRSFLESALSTILMSFIGVIRLFLKTFGAHGLLVSLLAISMATTLWTTSEWAATWWSDRRAVSYMRDLGVGPSPVMSKAIYLKDLYESFEPTVPKDGIQDFGNGTLSENKCAHTFQKILAQSSIDDPVASRSRPLASLPNAPSTRSTARRLQRTRQRLAVYRHDLVVAIRMVNRIDKDAVTAEYENWLVEESSTCMQVGQMLAARMARAKHAQQNSTDAVAAGTSETKDRLTEEDLIGLLEWHAGYCQSCEEEKVARLGSGPLDMRF